MKKIVTPLVIGMALAISAGPGLAVNPVELTLEQPLSIPAKFKSSVFIVQMKDDPVTNYEGGTGNLKATKPAKGKKLNPNSAAVKKYVAHLDGSHLRAMNALGISEKIYDYRFGLNGFAAVMTEAQAEAALKRDDVLQVWADEIKRPNTNSTPDYLGLMGSGGVWESYGKGEDVIVGVLDTGVWPEHPSFSDQKDFSGASGNSGKRNLAYGPAPSDWYGSCQSGERFSENDCNNKLIGAKYFHAGFGKGNSGIKISDYLSARDSDGHGSHTAGTAVGNEGVLNSLNSEPTSGMAPRARLAAYKVCWADRNGDASCASSDSAAAIDAAIADGVDVINFSIGGSSTVFAGPDDIGFLFAADAGIWVATSNGNAGPDAQTTGTPAGVPWITAVGATQDNQVFDLKLDVTGDLNDTYDALEGSGSSAAFDSYVTGQMVPADPLDACGPLNNSIAGEIAFVIRGVCNFSTKYINAAAAGASAIVVYNDGTNADRQAPLIMSAPGTSIPGAMISYDDGAMIYSTIVDDGGSVTGSGRLVSGDNRIAGFSSRGPNGGAMDIIKPDVSAPGVNIIAANTPLSSGSLWQSISGTSMASPHVAGVFALLKEVYPDWSPAMAKSALMTSARQDLKKTIGDTAADPFDIGSGHIVPNAAFEPGLVYDAGLYDYAAFSCGNNYQIFTDESCVYLESLGIPTDGSDLNLASIAVADLVGEQTITRTVTSVTGGETTFTAAVEVPAGVDVVVTPSELTIAEGDTATFTVTLSTNDTSVIGQWAFGSLTWNNDAGVSAARSPIAVKTVLFKAPNEVSGSGLSGSMSFDIGFGYSGDYFASVSGLVPADTQSGSVLDDPADDINTALGTCDWGSFPYKCTGITWHTFEVPADTSYTRFALFDAYTDGADDLDLYVWGPTGYVGSSGSGTSAEEVSQFFPVAGTYEIAVHGWETDGSGSSYTLFNWAIGADKGNMTVTAPTTDATLGAVETVTLDWSGLDADQKYLGAVVHKDANGMIGHTVVSISTE